MKASIKSTIVNLLVGLLISFIGFVNTFWGNDPYYGLSIILASVIFYLPIVNLILERISNKTQLIFKVIIGFFIIWSSLGVGELFDKIDLMNRNFPSPNYVSEVKD